MIWTVEKKRMKSAIVIALTAVEKREFVVIVYITIENEVNYLPATSLMISKEAMIEP